MSATFVTTEETASLTVEQIAPLDILFLLNLKPTGVPALKAALEQARQQNGKLIVLALDNRDSQKPIEAAGLMQRDEQIRRYWRYNGLENTRRLLRYVRHEYLDSQDEVEPPVVVPDHGIFHPQANDLFTDVPTYVSWLEAKRPLPASAPRIALLVQQSFLITGDTKVFEALVAAFEKRGVAIAVIFARDPKRQRRLLEAWQPELLIDDAHASPSLKAGAEELDLPLLKSVSLLRSTTDEWRQSPQGMLPADVSLHFLTQEVHGIIEPVLVGAQQANVAGFKLHEPIPDRVDRLADRAMSWLSLRKTSNADKKIAIVYYHKYLGQADVGRGSASGSFLDGPESLFRFLVALKQRGYTLARMPKDATELLAWMKREGRNVPNWAPGDLASLVEHARPVLIPLDAYLRRFSQLSEANRAAVSAAFGPPPGDQMVWSGDDQPALVVPRIDLGNVILLPQPARGPENDEKLLHARDVPPPHQYLACYWWLQDEFQPHAVVHFGTHGTEFLLPTKANGLSQDDFGDICLGNMPNIYPWIIDNLPEAMQAKRRAYAVTVDHLTPPLETTGLSPELRNLHDDIHKFQTLEDGLLKNKYRQSITAAARAAALADDAKKEPMSNEDIDALAAQLHAIESSVTAVKLHVLGEPPAGKHLVPFLTSMLGHAFFADMAEVLPVPSDIADEPDDRVAWARQQVEAMVGKMIDDDLSADEALSLSARSVPAGDPQHLRETLQLALTYRDRLASSAARDRQRPAGTRGPLRPARPRGRPCAKSRRHSHGPQPVRAEPGRSSHAAGLGSRRRARRRAAQAAARSQGRARSQRVRNDARLWRDRGAGPVPDGRSPAVGREQPGGRPGGDRPPGTEASARGRVHRDQRQHARQLPLTRQAPRPGRAARVGSRRAGQPCSHRYAGAGRVSGVAGFFRRARGRTRAGTDLRHQARRLRHAHFVSRSQVGCLG